MNTVRLWLLALSIVVPFHASAAVDPGIAVSAHNQVRETANQGGYPGQPTPNPSLRPVVWDQWLADGSQAYAEQCIWEHSPDRINTGENLYASTNQGSDAGDAVAAWADEHQYYDFATGECSPGEQCGHYTQVVWQGSVLIGCGEAACSPLRLSDGSVLFNSGKYQVCRYATAGNIIGNKPYETDGGNVSLVPSFTDTTGALMLPYVLVWNPENSVQPVAADFTLTNPAALTFVLDTAGNTSFDSEEEHGPIFDVNTQRLFLPNVDVSIGGQVSRHSAVLQYVLGTAPFEFVLTHFN